MPNNTSKSNFGNNSSIVEFHNGFSWVLTAGFCLFGVCLMSSYVSLADFQSTAVLCIFCSGRIP